MRQEGPTEAEKRRAMRADQSGPKAPPGDEIEICNDPYWNLAGAFYDLREQKADQVCLNTIERVMKQIAEMQKALTAAEARGYERGKAEAYPQGVRDGNAEWSKVHALGLKEGFDKGFLRCREESAKVAVETCLSRPGPGEACLCCQAIAAAIRSLKP